MTDILPILRMVMYGLVALYVVRQKRWAVWLTFTALVFSTYVYGYTGATPLFVESIRTCVGVLLAYITLRRK